MIVKLGGQGLARNLQLFHISYKRVASPNMDVTCLGASFSIRRSTNYLLRPPRTLLYNFEGAEHSSMAQTGHRTQARKCLGLGFRGPSLHTSPYTRI